MRGHGEPDQVSATDGDGAPGMDVEPVGVDEMIRRDRVKAISDARKTARKARLEANDQKAKGEDDYGIRLYRAAVEGYLREVEPLFKKTETGRRLWDEKRYGVIQVTPQPEDFPGDTSATKQFEQKQIPIEGLNALFEMSPPFRMEFHYVKNGPGVLDRTSSETVQVTRDIPMHTLDRMHSEVNGYLSKVGFGIEIDESDSRTKLDDDLLNEVEQWRRANL